MSAVREKDQADFDLEKMFEMLDEALTSKDERVQNALRGLLTIITLTRTQDDGEMAVTRALGPLRRIQEDLNELTRQVNNLRNEMRSPPTYYPPTQPGAGNPWNVPATGQPYTNPGSPYQAPYPYTGPGPFYTTTTASDGGVATQSPQLWNQK